MYKVFILLLLAILFLFIGRLSASAQTNVFTYQGSLRDGGAAAAGAYDLTVEIYDAESGGNLLATSEFTNVAVANGVFTLSVGVDPAIFNGTARYLQLRARRAGTGDFTVMSPRQMVASAPYALKSLTADNALQLGGVGANEFVQTSDARLTDARMPLAGSSNYIQNSVDTQSSSNFNVSGSGTVGNRFSVGAPLTTWRMNVFEPGNQGFRVQTATPGGSVASFGGFGLFQIDGPGFIGGRLTVAENGFVGLGTNNPQVKLHVLGQDVRVESTAALGYPRFSLNNSYAGTNTGKWQMYANGGGLNFGALNDAENQETVWMQVERNALNVPRVSFPNSVVRLGALGTAGSTSLCRNASGEIASCSSSLRYKENVADYKPGLDLIKRLRPVAFDWKADGKADFGLVAEEVAAVEPLLATVNEKGETEGVKYDRVGVVLVNAVREQQAEIDALRKQNEELRSRLEALEKMLRKTNAAEKEEK